MKYMYNFVIAIQTKNLEKILNREQKTIKGHLLVIEGGWNVSPFSVAPLLLKALEMLLRLLVSFKISVNTA